MRTSICPAVLLALPIALALGCATPTVEPMATVPLVPQEGEEVAVDHLMIIVDASGSVSRRSLFPQQKALVQSFVGSLPEGDYEAGQIAFGGFIRQRVAPADFDRGRLENGAAELRFLDEATQLDRVLRETAAQLEGREGKVAIVVFSDGKPTNPGGYRPIPVETLAVARALAASRADETCFFAVQTSDDPEGTRFLQSLSQITDCGAYRPADRLDDVASLHGFEREIFIGELPAVAAAVPSRQPPDLCTDTFPGSRAEGGGCWVASHQAFPLNSAEVGPGFDDQLDLLATTLRDHPDVEVRILGYTDSTGSRQVNEALSERRAESVKRALEARGVSPARMQTEGLGPADPLFPNDTPEGRSANRRIEYHFSR